MNIVKSGSVTISRNDRMVSTGSYLMPFHHKMTGQNVTVINDKCYIDGYELVDRKWKRTLKALWHKYTF